MQGRSTQSPVAIATVLFILALSFIGAVSKAGAQDYPNRTVRLIMPFPPGGTTDNVARAIADRLTKPLGQVVIIENRSGAGGMIGARVVTAARPDGYTLLFGASSVAVGMGFETKDPYDPLEDLTGVSMVAQVTLALAVHPSVPARTPKELVALIKSQPGKFNSAVPGMWSLPHLFLLLFMQRTDTKIEAIAYNGGGPAVTDLLSGRTQMTIINLPTIFQHINSGKLRAVGVAGLRRAEQLPNTMTFEESGYSGLTATTWNAIFAPKGTPAEINARLNREIVAILRSAEVKSYLGKFGAEPMIATPQESDAFVRSEAKLWRKVMADAGVKAE